MELQETDWALPEAFIQISGHLHTGQEKLLHDLAMQTPEDGIILEVGAHKGRSTCAIALACVNTQRHIYTIDAFTGKPDNTDDLSAPSYIGEFLKNLDRCNVVGYVTPLVGLSNEYWHDFKKPIDMLFIDGGHEHEVVTGDFNNFFPLLKAGGILAMHDVYSYECDSLSNGPNKVWCDHYGDLVDHVINHNLAWGWKLPGRSAGVKK